MGIHLYYNYYAEALHYYYQVILSFPQLESFCVCFSRVLPVVGFSIVVRNLIRCFRDVVQITSQKKKTGVIAPKRFVQRVKKQNELFRSYMHQVRDFVSFSCEIFVHSFVHSHDVCNG